MYLPFPFRSHLVMKLPEACTSELRGVKEVRVVGVLSHNDIWVAST